MSYVTYLFWNVKVALQDNAIVTLLRAMYFWKYQMQSEHTFGTVIDLGDVFNFVTLGRIINSSLLVSLPDTSIRSMRSCWPTLTSTTLDCCLTWLATWVSSVQSMPPFLCTRWVRCFFMISISHGTMVRIFLSLRWMTLMRPLTSSSKLNIHKPFNWKVRQLTQYCILSHVYAGVCVCFQARVTVWPSLHTRQATWWGVPCGR